MDQAKAVTALLARPSVDGLIYALRHEGVWPKGFEWDYSNCDQCAMGLAARLWSKIENGPEVGEDVLCERVMSVLHISGDAEHIFRRLHSDWDFATITPEHVAAALERYLDARP